MLQSTADRLFAPPPPPLTRGAVFSQTPLAPADAIFALTAAYVADQTKEKVNLGVGAYRDNQGKPYVLPVVRKVSLSYGVMGDIGCVEQSVSNRYFGGDVMDRR